MKRIGWIGLAAAVVTGVAVACEELSEGECAAPLIGEVAFAPDRPDADDAVEVSASVAHTHCGFYACLRYQIKPAGNEEWNQTLYRTEWEHFEAGPAVSFRAEIPPQPRAVAVRFWVEALSDHNRYGISAQNEYAIVQQ